MHPGDFDKIDERVLNAFRLTSTTFNAGLSLFLLPTAAAVDSFVKAAPTALQERALAFADLVSGPMGFLQSQAMPFFTRLSWSNALKGERGPHEEYTGKPIRADQRFGTEAMSAYLAHKITTNVLAQNQALAARLCGISHGLRQNAAVQFTVSYNLLSWATAADMVGYGLRLLQRQKPTRRFQYRNTAKALLMNLGMIAPAGDNLQDIIENSRYRPNHGRFAYEAGRISQRRAFAR